MHWRLLTLWCLNRRRDLYKHKQSIKHYIGSCYAISVLDTELLCSDGNAFKPTSSFWYAVTAMNCVSGKLKLLIRFFWALAVTLTTCKRGSYLCREFNMIWKYWDKFLWKYISTNFLPKWLWLYWIYSLQLQWSVLGRTESCDPSRGALCHSPMDVACLHSFVWSYTASPHVHIWISYFIFLSIFWVCLELHNYLENCSCMFAVYSSSSIDRSVRRHGRSLNIAVHKTERNCLQVTTFTWNENNYHYWLSHKLSIKMAKVLIMANTAANVADQVQLHRRIPTPNSISLLYISLWV